MYSEEPKNKTCFHCGEDCETLIEFQDKSFCCQGCKIVYSILSENELDNYYELNKNAGTSFKNIRQEKFSFLEDPDVREKIIDFSDEGITKVRFKLPQIHCSSCLYLLENIYQLNSSIQNSTVNFLKKEVSITFQEATLSLRALVELLASIGYSPVLNFENVKEKAVKKQSKALYYKLGLAGFAFGNIMFMSFPEYMGLSKSDDGSFALFFGYFNLILALPVLIYSASDYWKSAYHSIQQKHLNIDVPICLGMLALFTRSTYEVVSQAGVGYFDSLVGFIFFLLIGRWFQQKTYNNLSFDREYTSYFPIAITVKKGDKQESLVINKLKMKDVILIRFGELIPADSILLKGKAQIDYSFVTGESRLISKKIGDKIFAGGKQMGEAIELEVLKEVEQSYLTQLWNDDSFQKKTPIAENSSFTDKVAQKFTWIILLIALLTFLYWVKEDVGLAVNAMTAVLIVACPCALALSSPFIFGNVMRILGKQDIYLKNALVVEKMAQINHIVFDKTGTITTMNKKEVVWEGEELSLKQKQSIASLCSNSLHPVSQKIFSKLQDLQTVSVTQFSETIGKGIEGFVNNSFIKVGSSQFIDNAPQKNGTFIEIDHKILGYYSIDETYREGLEEIITELKKQNKLSVLTGDNDKEKKQLANLFGKGASLKFYQTPKDKLDFIKKAQGDQGTVLMIGDGLNDAGALQQSDVGLSITENASNFTPASDVIALGSSFVKLSKLLTFSKYSIYLLYIAYGISFFYNIVGLSFAVRAQLSPIVAAILMPLSSITTVVFGVLATNLVARWIKIHG